MASDPAGPDDEVAKAAHDLLNLLNVARTYTGIVQGQVEEATLAEYLERVQTAISKALELAHELQARGT